MSTIDLQTKVMYVVQWDGQERKRVAILTATEEDISAQKKMQKSLAKRKKQLAKKEAQQSSAPPQDLEAYLNELENAQMAVSYLDAKRLQIVYLNPEDEVCGSSGDLPIGFVLYFNCGPY